MLALILGARYLLTVVFAVAGIAKLRDLRGFRVSLAEFGVPSRLIDTVSLVVPMTELAVATLFLPAASAWWGGVAGFALVLVFSAAVVVARTNGRTPDCHCFGQLIVAPVSSITLLRNAGVAAGALLVVLGGREYDQSRAINGLPLPGLVLPTLALATIAAVFLRSSAQRLGRRRRVAAGRQKPLPPRPATGGRPATSVPSAIRAAPDFLLPALGRGLTDLKGLLADRLPVMLVFVSPACRRCRRVERRLAQWQDHYRGSVTIAIVTSGEVAANQHLADRLRLSTVLLQQDREVARAYGVGRTPAAILVAPDGTLASPVAVDVESIEDLVAGASTHRHT